MAFGEIDQTGTGSGYFIKGGISTIDNAAPCAVQLSDIVDTPFPIGFKRANLSNKAK